MSFFNECVSEGTWTEAEGSAGGTPGPSGLKARAEDSKAEIKSEAGGGSPLSCIEKGHTPKGVCPFSMNASRRGVERRRKGSAGGTPEPSGLKARQASEVEINPEAGGDPSRVA